MRADGVVWGMGLVAREVVWGSEAGQMEQLLDFPFAAAFLNRAFARTAAEVNTKSTSSW